MKLIAVAAASLALGGVGGGWVAREYFGKPFQVNVAVVRDLNLSIISNDNTDRPTILRVDDETFDFESPCVSRQLKRDDRADDYFELSARLPEASLHDPFFRDGHIRSFSFDCDKMLYSLSFDEMKRTTSFSIRRSH